ncbi:MAG: lysylphosphatidylglycerol synthase transmembrane domain-containing protein, partial [Actinomycetota bacterium]
MARTPEEVTAPKKKGALLKFLLRIAIGVAVVAVLIVRTPDRAQLRHALATARVGWVVAAALALFCGIAVSALRWRAYLDALEISMPFPTVLRLYFVGTFFNAFLPSGIGGDAYKAVRIGRARGGMAPAFASVFLDRFAGFVGLAGIGLVGALITLASRQKHLNVALVSTVLSIGMIGGALILLVWGERLLGRGRIIKEHGIGGKLREAVRAIHAAGRHPQAATRGYIYGVVFQLFVLGYHLCVARALRINALSVAAMTGVVVIASLATIIPLSPGGLGFRETAYVWALGSFGVPHDTALAFALLILIVLLM